MPAKVEHTKPLQNFVVLSPLKLSYGRELRSKQTTFLRERKRPRIAPYFGS